MTGGRRDSGRRRARLAVLGVVAGLVAGLATACGGPAPTVVTAQFRDSVGLYPGNPVAVLGVPIGVVRSITPRGTHVTVELELDPAVPVPADVVAVTVSPSVVTDRRVELTPAYRDGPRLRSGELIPLDRTRTPVEIDRVLAAVDRLADGLARTEGGTGVLSGAVDVAATNLAGNGSKLRDAVAGLAGLVGVGVDQADALTDLIRDVDRLSAAAAEQDAILRSFTTDLADATALLDAQGPELVETLRTVAELSRRAQAVLTQVRPDARTTLEGLGVTADTLAGRSRELAESADVLPTLFSNLVAIVDPESGRARVHDALDQTLRGQPLRDGCARLEFPPELCRADPISWLPLMTNGSVS
jgi:virulence factor Mce-like protein